MSTVSGPYPPGDLRVSDADRDAVLSELSEHFQAGRLTSAEFDERTGKALNARTESQLGVLTRDLPVLADAGATSVSHAGVRGAARVSCFRIAVVLAIVGSVVAAVSHRRVEVFPWWIIPLGYLLFRRLIRRV